MGNFGKETQLATENLFVENVGEGVTRRKMADVLHARSEIFKSLKMLFAKLKCLMPMAEFEMPSWFISSIWFFIILLNGDATNTTTPF